MSNCRKGPVKNGRAQRLLAAGRETLAMSVIVEEPASMRESRLSEREKHPDDIKPNNDSFIEKFEERPRRTTRDSSHALAPPAPESESKSRSASSSTSTTLSSSDEYHNSKTLQNQSQRFGANPPSNQSSNSRMRYRESFNKYARIPRSNPSRLDPEYPSRLNPSSSSSPEEEKERYDYHGRPSRRNTISQFSNTRLDFSSIRQSKESATSRGERRQSSPLYSTSDKRSRSRLSARLDSTPSASSTDMYEYRPREESRQASQSRSSSQERCRSMSYASVGVHGKRQMPPFRRPSHPVEDDTSSSNSSTEQKYAEERMRHGMPSHQFAATSYGRAKSSSPPTSLASFPESRSIEDRRLRPLTDASPPPIHRSSSNPKLTSRSYADGQCQLTSCSESKMPVAPSSKSLSLMKPSSKDKLQLSSNPLSSPRDSARMRFTSFLSKKSPTAASSGEWIPPRSPSASIFPTLASNSPLGMTAPESPLRLRHYEGRFSNRRSQTLFYFSLFPAEKMPLRGVVLCLHGLGDHCRRNVYMYERLCRESFGVITYDLLNHGVSDLDQQKTRAHIGNFTHLVEDTNDFIAFAKRSLYMDALRYWRKQQQRYNRRGQENNRDMALLPDLPLVIAGTSFGSLIGIHTILSGEHKFHAAVWGSPTIGVTWNPLLWAESKLAKPLAAVLPTTKLVPAIQYDILCRDPKFLRRFKADPLTSMDMMTTRTGHESLQAMIQLQEDERIRDPSSAFCAVSMLFLAGSADGISDQQAAIKFFSMLGNFDKEFKLFDGLFHLVYEEPEKEGVYKHLIQWLRRRFPDE